MVGLVHHRGDVEQGLDGMQPTLGKRRQGGVAFDEGWSSCPGRRAEGSR